MNWSIYGALTITSPALMSEEDMQETNSEISEEFAGKVMIFVSRSGASNC